MAYDMGRRYKSELEMSKVTVTARVQDTSGKYYGQESRGRDKALSDRIIKLIAQTSFPCPRDLDVNSEHSLRELCLALLESLDDRMMQLKHQRRANKHILNRLNEFQLRITHCPNGAFVLSPSVHLLDGYTKLHVDDNKPYPNKSKDIMGTSYDNDGKNNSSCILASDDNSIPSIQRKKTTPNDGDCQPNSQSGTVKVVLMKSCDTMVEDYQV